MSGWAKVWLYIICKPCLWQGYIQLPLFTYKRPLCIRYSFHFSFFMRWYPFKVELSMDALISIIQSRFSRGVNSVVGPVPKYLSWRTFKLLSSADIEWLLYLTPPTTTPQPTSKFFKLQNFYYIIHFLVVFFATLFFKFKLL